ncbi:MAG: Cytochrome c, class, partial [Betaproteobacteria bacterium]|nr:Cytochrome c, class [Betaproteobacteria bacterium]
AMLGAAMLVLAAAPACAADAAATEKKAALCVACHGPNGNSAIPANPSLAGQPSQFITTQLIMFREGRRKDPQMSPIAASLANADINEFGKYFSAQKPAPPARKTDPAKVAEGRRLTEQYNCTACHGAELKGQQHIPRLVGQQMDYLRTQLHGFKAGTRFDMDGNMTSAAQPLSEKDIEVLADYLSALQ